MMTKNIKKINIKIIIGIAIFILMVASSIKKTSLVLANTSQFAKLYLVFDQKTYEVGDTVELNINLDQFASLNEIKLQIKIDESYLEPIKIEDKYFYFSTSSIFNNDIINDYVDNHYVRLRLLKDKNIEEGFFSSYKNNICNIKFKVKKTIDDIAKFFTLENYNEMGISIYLFDINDQLIPYQIYNREKIKVKWDVDNYELNVYSELPDFKKDIIILNREVDEYEYLIEKQVNTAVIGLDTVHIGIYDKSSADYIVLSKAISIVDLIAPTIDFPLTIEIIDELIDTTDYFNYISIHDNYDSNLESQIKYYDDELNEISSVESFKDFLLSSPKGYIQFLVEDTSGNETSTPHIEVQIIDTKAPTIHKVEKIILNDIDVDSFILEDYFIIEDNYDDSPQIVFDFGEHNALSFLEIKEILKKGIAIPFSYFAIDKSMNYSQSFDSVIEVIDTTCPTLSVSDIIVEDVEYDKVHFDEFVNVKDNFLDSCILETNYYIENQKESKDRFDELIQKGYSGYISYVAIDKAGNKSQSVKQNVTVIDTIPPQIIIKNIQNGQKYVKLNQIEYEIIENFDHVEVIILLDDQIYTDEMLQLGKHKLYIKAQDTSGHETEVLLEFEIIEDNLIGCLNDFGCYINNYIEVVIIVTILLIFVIIMIIVKLILKRRKHKIV